MSTLTDETVPQAESAIPLPDPLTPTVFHEPWWLEIATGGKYGVAEVLENGAVVGRLPYYIRSNCGIARGVLPHLTHFLGPAVIEGPGSANTRFLKRMEITQALLAQLPKTHEFYIKCQRDITDAIAFQKAGFWAYVQFTYEIPPQPAENILKAMHHKKRYGIKQAQKQLKCADIGVDEFMEFSRKNMQSYGIDSYYSLELCRKLATAAIERGQGRLLAAKDEAGKIAAATFCVWDATSYYYFMSSRSPSTYKGVTSLLVWEAVQDAMRRHIIFDFDGLSSDESVAFYSSFGAQIAPRYIAKRASGPMAVLRAVQNMFVRPNYYC